MHFPIFLDLRSRPVLVVGGGRVAFGKVASLLEAGASVTVVAPRIDKSVNGAELVVREFQPRDLDGKWLAVAAATPEVNREVARAAGERRIFVNAVDDTASASAYLGGVVRKGGVTLAVSTDGRAPALAGLLREALAALLPEELEQWTHTAAQARALWKAARVPIRERRPLLLEALNALYHPGHGDHAAGSIRRSA
jgi:uroporphyrin-III C-methyltransferase / precorrin-2 dehydrogenase / sirohydrochlorin ferrochelatase